MKAANKKIFVTSDLTQKDRTTVGGVELLMARSFDHNYRERSPVLATVAEDNDLGLSKGTVLVLHHNTLYEENHCPSPYWVEDDLFSIPANGEVIFAKVLGDGSLWPVFGNLLIDRIDKEASLPLPPELREQYTNKAVVREPGLTLYRKGQTVFHWPHRYYEVVYTAGGVTHRVHKLHEKWVVGYRR